MGASLFIPALVTSEGSPFTTPDGCFFISISPVDDATFKITNPHGQESPVLSQVFSFPQLSSPGPWGPHTITAVSGSVIVSYSNR
jgi:hypothetical protein